MLNTNEQVVTILKSGYYFYSFTRTPLLLRRTYYLLVIGPIHKIYGYHLFCLSILTTQLTHKR